MTSPTPIRDLDRVVLTADVAGSDAAFKDHVFPRGASGVVVYVYSSGAGFEVEIFGATGETLVLASARREDLRLVAPEGSATRRADAA
jgi:hypothetical protein